jgi:hypothetical protein
MIEEEKESGLILDSILIGLILTFVSLVYYHREYYFWIDWGSVSSIGGAPAYGFPIGWIVIGGPSFFISPFDPVGFLFDIVFWTVVAYVILRFVVPNLKKLRQKILNY